MNCLFADYNVLAGSAQLSSILNKNAILLLLLLIIIIITV